MQSNCFPSKFLNNLFKPLAKIVLV